jgi:ThiF family
MLSRQLAYLGVHDFRLVDFDTVTDSSLNRVIGATDADVAAETKEIVALAKRMIEAIIPGATVDLVDAKIDHGKASPRSRRPTLSSAASTATCLGSRRPSSAPATPSRSSIWPVTLAPT